MVSGFGGRGQEGLLRMQCCDLFDYLTGTERPDCRRVLRMACALLGMTVRGKHGAESDNVIGQIRLQQVE